MKTSQIVTSACILGCLLLLTTQALSQVDMQQSMKNLELHEKKYNNSTFRWKVKYVRQFVAGDAQSIDARIADVDQKLKNKQITSSHATMMRESLEREKQPQEITLEDTWVYQSNPSKTLVSGRLKHGGQLETYISYVHHYAGNQGTLVYTSKEYVNEKASDRALIEKFHMKANRTVPEASVWKAKGESIRYRTPVLEGLNIKPEDFVLLAAKSPFMMYGANWKKSTKPNEEHLYEATISESSDSPFSVSIRIDPTHLLPKEIIVSLLGAKETYEVLDYQQTGDSWLPKQVRYHFTSPLTTIEIDYELEGVDTSKAIDFNLKDKSTYVTDYRKLGGNLSVNKLLKSQGDKASPIVRYESKDKIPNESELDRVAAQSDNKRHWDVSPWTLALWIPGIVALVTGGILLWKKRRGSSSK